MLDLDRLRIIYAMMRAFQSILQNPYAMKAVPRLYVQLQVCLCVSCLFCVGVLFVSLYHLQIASSEKPILCERFIANYLASNETDGEIQFPQGYFPLVFSIWERHV